MTRALILGVVAALCGLSLIAAGHFGPFVIDEMFYQAMAQRMSESGALSIDNGWADHPLEPMRVHFLRVGLDGLYPQYPAGYALIAAPFFAVFGVNGLLALQTLAFSACIPLTASLAKTLTGADDRSVFRAAAIFALATFAADYAIAIWPHALATLFVLTGWLAAARGWSGAGGRWVALSGLLLSLGLTIRADVILALPPVAAFALAHPDRPRFALGWLALGLAPGLALASALNYAKFGVLAPISYGAGGGGVSLTSHLALAPAAAAFAFGALALRSGRLRALALSPWALLGAAGLVALAAAAPVVGPLIRDMLSGAFALLMDSQALHVEPWQAEISEIEGFAAPFGVFKLALFQSMPWALAAVVLAIGAVWTRGAGDRARAGLVFCLVAICVWVAPFAKSAWHGGLSNSMRYFWPLLPLLAVMASGAWERLQAHAGRRPRALIIGAAAASGFLAILVGVEMTWAGPNPAAGALVQLYAPLVLAAAASVGLSALLSRPPAGAARAVAAMALLAAGFGAGAAATFADDAPRSLARRADMARLAEEMSVLPEKSFVIGLFPEIFAKRLVDPERRIATLFGSEPEDLAALADRHLSSGWTVFAWPAWVGARVADASGGSLTSSIHGLAPDLAQITQAR